jgi:SpoVK/Ycf46/Vps4 family AAA+-type ATPase
VVIAAGYPEKMEQFRLANPGLSRRFPVENIIDFKDYAIGELRKILIDGVNQKSLMMSKESKERLFEIVAEMHKRKDKNFGNAGEIRNLIEGIDRRRALRLSTRTSSNDPEIQLEDIPPSYQNLLPAPASLASKEFLEVIDSLIGLTLVKTRLREMAVRTEYEFARYRANKHNSGRPGLQHLIFIGNPGTGKTTVARMVAEFYKSLGLLSRGQCIEVTRGDLVAGYVGQTAIRTAEKITSALDGVLFIDEAYSLVGSSENDFGNEAIDTLVKMMEDHKDRLVVIAAGYPKEMGAFLNSNPGLKSRFSEPILFEDYSVGELVRIFSFQLEKEHYHTSSEVLERVREYLETIQIRDGLSFHNARSVLQLIEATKTRLAQRVLPLMSDNDDDQTRVLLNHILPEDIPHPGFYMGQFPPKAMQNTKASSTPKF